MSEPQHIGEILPKVLEVIKERCNKYRVLHILPTLDDEITVKGIEDES